MIRLLSRSLQLDIGFLSLDLKFSQKIQFLIEKYFLLIQEYIRFIIPFNRRADIFGQSYYYDDRYGLAVLQGTFIDHSFLRKFIPHSATVVDVGANIGQFNFMCRHYLQAKRVYSFEPVQETYTYLKKNSLKYIYHAAVSTKQSLKIYIANLSVWSSVYLENPTDKVEKVNTVKLDSFEPLEKEKIIHLFKIDTEGTEMDVLRASRKIVKKSKYILIEVQFMRLADNNLSDIMTFLEREIPGVEIIRIGRVYNAEREGTTGGADILFRNPNLSL